MGTSNDDTGGAALLGEKKVPRDPRRAHARLMTPASIELDELQLPAHFA